MRDMGDIHPTTPGGPLETASGGRGKEGSDESAAQAAGSIYSSSSTRYESA